MWEEIRRPATAIAIALAVISTVAGILASLYFYLKGEKHAEIAFKVEQVQVFDKTHVGVVPLTVRDESGNTIDNNVYAANIIIWNHGNTEARKEEVREPYRLAVQSNTARILEISPTFYSRGNVDGFTVNRKTGELSWQHFDEGEGLKLRMMYVDQEMRNIILEGYSVNTTILNGQELGKQHNEQVQTNKSIIYIWEGRQCVSNVNRSIHCYKTEEESEYYLDGTRFMHRVCYSAVYKAASRTDAAIRLSIGARPVKSYPGPSMTLGNAAAARGRLIVWCKACQHQVEPGRPRRLLGTAPKRGQELCGCATQLGKTEIVG